MNKDTRVRDRHHIYLERKYSKEINEYWNKLNEKRVLKGYRPLLFGTFVRYALLSYIEAHELLDDIGPL